MVEDFGELADAITIAYSNLQEAMKGNKAAGLRLRKQMNKVKVLAKSIITKSKKV